MAIVGVIGAAHTPYAQWTVYRRRNLFIVASRTDPAAVALAERIAAGLAERLPASRARHTRASDPVRIASLLATGQIDVAVVSREEAEGMLAGEGAYAAVGPVPVRRVFDFERHALIALVNFKPSHAYLLAKALAGLRVQPLIRPADAREAASLPYHPGAVAYRQGTDMPADEPPDSHAHE